MNAALVRHVLLCILLMPVAALQAQQPDATESAEQQQGASSADQNSNDDEQSEPGSETNPETDLPDIDSQPIESSQSQGPGRFIPSEQISQDFGVSFPVDI